MKDCFNGIRTEYEDSDYIHTGGYDFNALRLRQKAFIDDAKSKEPPSDKRCPAISPNGVRCGMPIHSENLKHSNGLTCASWTGDHKK